MLSLVFKPFPALYAERLIGLLEKCGFVRKAYFKENYYFEGKFMDSAIYSLLHHEKNKKEHHFENMP